ncbi:hypothetical protein H4R34_001168 [Dimargaris verticillata]|uniref:HTH La-type RNA-binding domain-containing protein n=1 Tax=Dimargaris verticillata TaxID=2761393 RepID=A0A9W8B6Q9_9FUNG|nr:hypothetical protein H4R34_001168 [Dimargaris verticillata]
MASTSHLLVANSATSAAADSSEQYTVLKDRIRQQVEYYFSPENLAHDSYLCSQMDPQGNVPIIIVAAFKKLRALTRDVSLIIDAMAESSMVAMDDEQKYFRPNFPREHRLLLLSQVPESCTREDIVALCDNLKSVPLIDLYTCNATTWEIRLATEREAQRLLDYIQDQSLGGAPIRASLKAEPLFQGTWCANPQQPLYQDPVAPYADQLCVPSAQPYSFPYIPYYGPNPMLASVAPGYPGGDYYGYYSAPYYAPAYYPQAAQHQSPKRRNRNGRNHRKSGTNKKSAAGAKANGAAGSPRRSNRKNNHKTVADQPCNPLGDKAPVSVHKVSAKSGARSQPFVQPADSVVGAVTPPPSPKEFRASTKASEPADRDAIAVSDISSRPLTPVSEKPQSMTPPNEPTTPWASPGGKKGTKKSSGYRLQTHGRCVDRSSCAKGTARPLVAPSPDLRTHSFPPLPAKPAPTQAQAKAKRSSPKPVNQATLTPMPSSPAKAKTLADIVKGNSTPTLSRSSIQPKPLHDEYPGLMSDGSSGETLDTISVTSSLASSASTMAPAATTLLTASIFTVSTQLSPSAPQHSINMVPIVHSYAQALRQPAIKST